MNCKFCGNFVPEGKDSCPVCGRRPDEEPIGKLLSENQPSTALQTTEPAAATAEAPAAKKHPTGLLLPLIMIAISAAGWVYGLIGDQKIFSSLFASVFKTGTGMAADSNYVTPTNPDEMTGLLLIGGLAIILTLIGIAGIIMLFKRLYNRVKY